MTSKYTVSAQYMSLLLLLFSPLLLFRLLCELFFCVLSLPETGCSQCSHLNLISLPTHSLWARVHSHSKSWWLLAHCPWPHPSLSIRPHPHLPSACFLPSFPIPSLVLSLSITSSTAHAGHAGDTGITGDSALSSYIQSDLLIRLPGNIY